MRLEFHCRHRYASGFTLDVEFASQRPVTALFGRSGSGKTSVLHTIAGLLRPDQGRVRLGDDVLLDVAAGIYCPLHRRGIGCVFQDHLLFPHLTVRRNLEYGSKRRPRAAARVELPRVVEVLEIGPLLDRYPRTLSGGERQRVAFGRALLSQPRLLLLDEPWSALDGALKHRLLAYLEQALATWELPAVVVSHDQASVRRLAQWVVLMDAGTAAFAGPPEEVLSQPLALGLKDDARPVNLLRMADVRERDGRWQGRLGERWLTLPSQPPSPASAVYLEFLPGDVALAPSDVTGLSIRNRLPGEVRQLVTLADGVFVAVAVEGQTIWAEVTPEAVAELALAPGRPVVCLVKTHSLRVES
jgi:molybdate transport system ATP-binding protein